MKKLIIIFILMFAVVTNSRSDYIPYAIPVVPTTQPKSESDIEKLKKEVFDLQVDVLILQIKLKALLDHVKQSPNLSDKPKEIII